MVIRSQSTGQLWTTPTATFPNPARGCGPTVNGPVDDGYRSNQIVCTLFPAPIFGAIRDRLTGTKQAPGRVFGDPLTEGSNRSEGIG